MKTNNKKPAASKAPAEMPMRQSSEESSQPERIRSVQLDQLKAHPSNAQIYGDEPDKKLVQSIKDHGVLQPLLVTPENVVLSGHLRLKANPRSERTRCRQECFDVWRVELAPDVVELDEWPASDESLREAFVGGPDASLSCGDEGGRLVVDGAPDPLAVGLSALRLIGLGHVSGHVSRDEVSQLECRGVQTRQRTGAVAGSLEIELVEQACERRSGFADWNFGRPAPSGTRIPPCSLW